MPTSTTLTASQAAFADDRAVPKTDPDLKALLDARWMRTFVSALGGRARTARMLTHRQGDRSAAPSEI